MHYVNLLYCLYFNTKEGAIQCMMNYTIMVY
nr:MAG TPA: hypothetical protein [Caudoviricetes sp.]